MSTNDDKADDAPLTKEQLLEEVNRKAGEEAAESVLEDIHNYVLEVQNKFSIRIQDIFDVEGIRNATAIPQEIRARLRVHREKMGSLIRAVATRIEHDKRKQEVRFDSGSRGLTLKDREDLENLSGAQEKFYISLQAFNTTVDLVRRLNENILERLSNQLADQKQQRMMMVMNSVIVFELLDFAVRYFKEFQLDGEDEIRKLWLEKQREREEIRRNEKALQTRASAQDEDVDVAQRNSILEDSRARLEAVLIVDQEWQSVMANLEDQKNQIHKLLRSLIKDLELSRDNARNQLALLQYAALTNSVRTSQIEIERAAKSLAKLRLERLTAEKMRHLLGIDRNDVDRSHDKGVRNKLPNL